MLPVDANSDVATSLLYQYWWVICCSTVESVRKWLMVYRAALVRQHTISSTCCIVDVSHTSTVTVVLRSQ